MITEAGNPEASNRVEVVCHTCNHFRQSAALRPVTMYELEEDDLLTEGQIRTARRLVEAHNVLFGGGHIIAFLWLIKRLSDED